MHDCGFNIYILAGDTKVCHGLNQYTDRHRTKLLLIGAIVSLLIVKSDTVSDLRGRCFCAQMNQDILRCRRPGIPLHCTNNQDMLGTGHSEQS